MEKQIEQHPRYTVTEDGRVYTVYNKEKLQLAVMYKKQYPQVRLSINGKRKDAVIHRLVAVAFVPNPDNKPEVNHIDGNKLNYHYTNLEWVTRKENIRHAWDNGLSKSYWKGRFGSLHHNSKAIIQYTKNGEYVAEFGSQYEAARETGVNPSSISSVLMGRTITAGNYIWGFKESIFPRCIVCGK